MRIGAIVKALSYFAFIVLANPMWAELPGCLGASIFRETKLELVEHFEAKSELHSVFSDVLNTLEVSEKYGDVRLEYYRGLGSPRALPNCFNHRKPGTIQIDLDMIEEVAIIRFAIETILAHELGHILQFLADEELTSRLCAREKVRSKKYELLADVSAGYVVGSMRRSSQQPVVSRVIARLADYDFANPSHHGTVSERINAWAIGQHAIEAGYSLKMSVLLENVGVFMDVLGGPPASLSSPEQQRQYINSALRRVFR